MSGPNLALSDEDFMAQLLGVKPKDIEERTVNVTEQLQGQLSSIHDQRTVVQNFQGMPSEHFRSGR